MFFLSWFSANPSATLSWSDLGRIFWYAANNEHMYLLNALSTLPDLDAEQLHELCKKAVYQEKPSIIKSLSQIPAFSDKKPWNFRDLREHDGQTVLHLAAHKVEI